MIGTVTGISKYGYFMRLDNGQTGLLRWRYFPKWHEKLSVGQSVLVVIKQTHEDGKLELGLEDRLLEVTQEQLTQLQSQLETLEAENHRVLHGTDSTNER
jgi:predicted RNA-binding protein with RPS1 domain